MVELTAIADAFDRGRSVGTGRCSAAGMRLALYRYNLADILFRWLISVTKTNGAASDASRLFNVTMSILQRRSSDDD